MSEAVNRARVLSVFSLVMINVIAVDSLRTLPISAAYGTSLIFYYIIGAIFFFIPTALVTAELATSWPKTGGIYIWVREALGAKWGFFIIWMQWIYNVIWYPTILSFVAAMIAYIISPELIEQRQYVIYTLLILFWSATLINFLGMKASSWVSTVGSIFGTLLPMAFIIVLALMWWFGGHESQVSFDLNSIIPTIDDISDLVLFSAILYGLVGLEMSAVHAQEVKNPKKDYPRALLISAIIIIFSLVFSSLAVAVVVPQGELNLVAGVIQAFDKFFAQLGMQWLTPILALLMIIGALSSVVTWIIGPTKGMFAAAADGEMPKFLAITNKKGVPIAMLLTQGVIFTALTLVYLLLPTVKTSYWILTELTAQLALLVYVFMFAVAIKLRYSKKQVERPFRIPGGNWGMWLVAGCGLLVCVSMILIGFVPPKQIEIENIWLYEGVLIGGFILFSCPPLLMDYVERKFHARKAQRKVITQ